MKRKRFLLYAIALPAGVAIWTGWVGLGALCGFGLIEPFPGIVPWHLNTAITLPVGIEAYAWYSISVWLDPAEPDGARNFARRSAAGALIIGLLGQVSYHLLASHGATRAPDVVVVLVSAMPVAVVFMAAVLTHLTRTAATVADGTPVAEMAARVADLDTQTAVSALRSVGIEDTGQLAAIVGVTPRHINRLKAAEQAGDGGPAVSPAEDTPGADPAVLGRHRTGRPRLVTSPAGAET